MVLQVLWFSATGTALRDITTLNNSTPLYQRAVGPESRNKISEITFFVYTF